MSFDSTKTTLEKLLEQVDDGTLQLPEFQRDYVWTEEAVVSLLASIANGYPVGALLLLERGGEVDFQPRPIEGTQVAKGRRPDLLLLDGQQRMTSLYQVLWTERPAMLKNAKGQKVERHLFVDIKKAVASGVPFEEAVEVLPGDRRRMKAFGKEVDLDLSTSELQFAQNLFPLDRVYDEDEWLYGWRDYWRGRGEDPYELEKQFKQSVIKRIQKYEMPIIELKKDNGREAVCTIFEKVNVGGVKLDAFELVTAIYAGEEFDLRRDWSGTAEEHGRLGRIRKSTPEHGVHSQLASLEFLQACTVLHTREQREAAREAGREGLDLPQVTCKREAVLALPLGSYKQFADQVEEGFVEAGSFLNEQKILWGRDVPYPPQVVAMASLFAVLGSKAKNAAHRDKLARWFWSGVLGEYYGSATESKIARDVPELVSWLDGGPEPRTLQDTLFQVSRLHSLRSRGSAAYKGFHALLMRSGCRDFISGKAVELMTVYSNPLDIHHIFPKAWCEAQGIPPRVYNSIINKTALSAETNRIIGGNAPSIYLERVEKRTGLTSDDLDQILETHLINPSLLRTDNFEAFFSDREKRLADLAASAMGKAVVADLSAEEGVIGDEDLSIDEEETVEEAA
jgi:hypothetical protein